MSDPTNIPSAFTPRRAAIAASVGNVLEWYDFAVYAFFAGTIGRLFFPNSNEIDSLIAAFGVFAAGYLMRPLGGILFGHIGDRYGRKPVCFLPSRRSGQWPPSSWWSCVCFRASQSEAST